MLDEIVVSEELKLKSILIVDDEPEILEALVEILGDFELNVSFASGGHEAFEKFQESPFDIVLSDVLMPNGDGIQLLERLKEAEGPTPTFLYISAFSNKTEQEIIEMGALGVVPKPIDFKKLFSLLEASLS